MAESGERLRAHPEKRFAPAEQSFNLSDAAEKLKREPSGEHGHKQITLFKHGPETLALFHFDAGSHLPDHSVDGPVFIYVLSGKLHVTTAEQTHELPSNTLLRLAPRVKHDVQAEEASEMLLTVCLDRFPST